MKELGRGLHDLSRGFAFLGQHPRLWGWVIAPAVVTLLLLAGVIVVVMRVADAIVTKVGSWLPSSIAHAGEWLVWAVVLAALITGALLIFVSVAGVVAGPFNELLSEAVEERVTGTPGPPFSMVAFAKSALKGIGHGVLRVIVAVAGALVLFAIGFVPVVGTIAALVLGYYFAALAAAYDCYDAVLSRRDLAYGEKTSYLARYRGRTLGLGAAVAALLVVPIANVLALGVGAIGATLAVLDQGAHGAGGPST